MKNKKANHNSGINLLLKLIKFIIIILIIISAFILLKYGPTISSLYNDATTKVSNCTISTFDSNKNPLYLKSSQIPSNVKNAFVAIEDKDFYNHGGISIVAISRSIYSALTNNLVVTQGGSTITQQLARNVFLNFDKDYHRKVEEMFISVKLEQKFTKDQILEFYINDVNFSNNAYGINTAANKFFNKNVSELNLSQICFLVSIPNDPSYYNPVKHLSNTLQRRNLVLEKMKQYNYITDTQYQDAINYKIVLSLGQ